MNMALAVLFLLSLPRATGNRNCCSVVCPYACLNDKEREKKMNCTITEIT